MNFLLKLIMVSWNTKFQRNHLLISTNFHYEFNKVLVSIHTVDIASSWMNRFTVIRTLERALSLVSIRSYYEFFRHFLRIEIVTLHFYRTWRFNGYIASIIKRSKELSHGLMSQTTNLYGDRVLPKYVNILMSNRSLLLRNRDQKNLLH